MVAATNKKDPGAFLLQRGQVGKKKHCRTESTTDRYKKTDFEGVSCGQFLAASPIRRSEETDMFRCGAASKISRQYFFGSVFNRSHPLTRSAGMPRSAARFSLPHVVIISRLLCMCAILEHHSKFVKEQYSNALPR